MIRIVPCMAGWDGPMLRSMLSGRASRWSRVKGSISDVVLERDARLLEPPGIGLPQRMALEALVRQKPPEIRMAVEPDAEHVEDLALEPFGVLPQADDRLDRGVGGRERGREPQADVAGQGIQMINEL